MKASEFWWPTPDEMSKYTWLEVLHTDPHSDEPGSDLRPLRVGSYRSVGLDGSLSCRRKRYHTDFLDVWRERVGNINVFRGLRLYSAEEDGTEMAGPLVIDIDSEDSTARSSGYCPNIHHSLQTARRILDGPLSGLSETDYRVYFTGNKGFSIEVCPKALGHVYSYALGLA